MRQVVLDTETTGLDPQQGHRITEIGCYELMDRKITGCVFHKYLNPEREIELKAVKITGLTWNNLKNKPKFVEIVEEFINFIHNAELIIHNAPFDLSFINNELKIINHTWTSIANNIKIIDTLSLARKLHPGQRNNLDALCKRYLIDNSHRNYHGALLDAKILAQVYLAMTSGQANLDLDLKNNKNTHIYSIKNKNKKNYNLPIIHITAQEELEHKAMLKLINKQI